MGQLSDPSCRSQTLVVLRNVAQKYYVRQLLGQSEESIRDAWAKVGFSIMVLGGVDQR